MALKLSKPSIFGVDGEYWRITTVQMMPKSSLRIDVSQFASKDARLAGSSQMAVVTKFVPLSEDVPTSIVAFAYEQLKLLPEFAGAVDA